MSTVAPAKKGDRLWHACRHTGKVTPITVTRIVRGLVYSAEGLVDLFGAFHPDEPSAHAYVVACFDRLADDYTASAAKARATADSHRVD